MGCIISSFLLGLKWKLKEGVCMIEFKNVTKKYKGNVTAVDDFSLKIETGEFICFIGTSGSGKTTSMRMINRMVEPSSGTITIDGKDISTENEVDLRRSIGYVIQNVGLMPHMTIRDNIVMVPKLLGWDQSKLDEIALKMIRTAELPEEMLDRYPSELSGGQQQRIGVVRALAADQEIILMDEPFGALDPITRDTLQELVKNLQEKTNKTIVFVTHDMDEAIKLATRIVIMDEGRIIQVGTPEEILKNPANKFVEDLIGHERLAQAKQDFTTVKEVMSTRFISITLGQSLTKALSKMHENKVDTLLVTDAAGHLKGIVDIRTLQANFNRATSVSDIMNKNFVYARLTALVKDILDYILTRGYSYVPIVDDNMKLVGIVTRATLVNIIYDAIWGEDDESSEKESSSQTSIEGHGQMVAPVSDESDGVVQL